MKPACWRCTVTTTYRNSTCATRTRRVCTGSPRSSGTTASANTKTPTGSTAMPTASSSRKTRRTTPGTRTKSSSSPTVRPLMVMDVLRSRNEAAVVCRLLYGGYQVTVPIGAGYKAILARDERGIRISYLKCTSNGSSEPTQALAIMFLTPSADQEQQQQSQPLWEGCASP